MIRKILYFFPLLLAAHPSGGKPVSGTVELSQNGTTYTIQASDRSVIHWDHFGIDTGESLFFIQPGSHSAVLNRVTGTSSSEIHGLLQANGRVYLINPNGILIGPEGIIQTAGFLGSTLDLLGTPFDPDHPLRFEGEGHEFLNFGQIRGEEWVCLVSPKITNEGTIEGGSVALASAHSILMRPRSQDTIWVEVENPDFSEPFAHAINLKGAVRANHLAHQNGEIVLKADTITIEGVLDAPSGAISASGQRIALSETSFISASGHDANKSGDILIIADEQLHFAGAIEAKGGPSGGDGGFVELSGKTMLFQGTVDRRASHGQAGTLLIDPSDILITTTTTGNVMFAANTYSVNAALPTPATIDSADISTNLGLGPVTITTSSSFNDVGNITITNPIAWASGFPLTLLANGSIILQNTDISDNAAAVTTLIAQDSVILNGSGISSTSGDILITATQGSLTLTGIAGSSAVIGTFGGDITIVAGQDVSLINSGNPLTTEVVIGVLPGGGSTSITAGRDILLFNQVLATTPNPAAIGGSNTLDLTAGRDVIFRNPNTFAATATGDLNVIAGRNVSLDLNCGIFSVNTSATITIVTDNQAPNAPQVGDGGLIMNPLSVIGFVPIGMTPPLNIRIYTARPSQNQIAILNWVPFVHDPAQVDTATEVYGVYFPSAIPITSPLQYIVFYKTLDVPVQIITQQVPQVISSGFEALRRFSYRHPYSLLNQVERFWTLYKQGDPDLNRTLEFIYLNNYREFTP